MFLAIVVVVGGAFVTGVAVGSRRTGASAAVARRRAGLAAAGLAAWIGVVSAAVASGSLEGALGPVPRILPFLLACNLVAVAVGLSPVGKWLAAVPVWALVAFHGFRLPLELVLHRWAEGGTVPWTMTWTGANPDIVTGIAALALAPLAHVRAVAWTFEVLGVVLLLNVARVAVLSSPVPFGWGVEPPLQLGFHLPYAWIVPVCVAGALLGHLVLARALVRR